MVGHFKGNAVLVSTVYREISGLGAMIAMGPSAVELATPERFSAGIRRIAEITHDGSYRRLAASLKINPTVMAGWVRLSKRPRMDSFLEVCYRLGINPVDLLQGYMPSSEPRLRPGSLPLSRPSHKLPSERLRAVVAEIHRIVFNDGNPIPLSELARAFGTSPGHLRYQLPEACECLLTHNATVGRRINEAKREKRIRRAQLIVQDLFAQQTHLPRRRVTTALAAQGLNIRCPDTRRAAYDEIQRLNDELLTQLEEQRMSMSTERLL